MTDTLLNKHRRGIGIPIKAVMATIWNFAKDKPLGAASGALFLLFILVAIIGPWIVPFDPTGNNLPQRLVSPSISHLMGTDAFGRDIFSRIIAGTRLAILVSLTSSFFGITLGTLLGILSGYIGGKLDMTIQRVMDVLMSFPSLILAIAIVAVMGNSAINLIIAIAIPMIPRANRVSRSVAVSLRQAVFIEAVLSVGAKLYRVLIKHVLPNCMAAYLILLTSALGAAVLVEASLSFLGLGIPPPSPSWGRDLNEAMPFLDRYPWVAIFPGIAISLAVFAANFFGDAIRDQLDPRLKRL